MKSSAMIHPPMCPMLPKKAPINIKTSLKANPITKKTMAKMPNLLHIDEKSMSSPPIII
jgi:hypothetical protein